MNAKRLAAVATATGVATYVLLAPLRCVGGARPHCDGLLAFEYLGARNLLAPQAIATSIVVGVLTTFVMWLVVARPKGPSLVRFGMALFLPLVTFVAALSLGGAMMYAFPVLLPLYWWMASQSGYVGRTAWALLAAGATAEALFLAAYALIGVELHIFVVVVPAVVAGAVVSRAPDRRARDVWARPIDSSGLRPRTMGT